MQGNYPRLLKWTLRHRFAVLGGSFAALRADDDPRVPRLGHDLISPGSPG